VKARTSIIPFVAVEALVLLAIVIPVAHARSFVERLLLGSEAPLLVSFAPDEGRYILLRSLLMVVALQIAFAFRDLYRWNVIMRPQFSVVRLVEGIATVLIGLPLLYFVFSELDRSFELRGTLLRLEIHPMLVLAASGGAFLAGYGLRVRWPRWVRRSRLAERVVILGRGPAVDVAEEEILRRHDPGIDLIGFLDQADAPATQRELLGTFKEAAEIAKRHGVQRVLVGNSAQLSNSELLALRKADVKIQHLSEFYEQFTGRISVENLSSPDLFVTSAAGTGIGNSVISRLIDLVVASLGLLLAAPLCLLTALAIKLESRGPVLYRQERIGRNGHVFTLVKFRSMRTDAEAASGPVWAQGDDTRITRVGRWLRKLRIDELPQLWSVVRNDMSLVGPRPERPFFVDELERQIPHYRQRLIVKPGVTGWAQINYSYGNTVDDAFIKLQYDLYYVKHRSIALDIAILLRTIKVVALQRGAV
jgi:exopolysaccharide biosynthesis polyprenyl glycosylphosphotransferase